MAPKVDPDELLTAEEVAPIAGLTSGRAVSVYASRYSDFPRPVVKKPRCTLWLRADVERWATARRNV